MYLLFIFAKVTGEPLIQRRDDTAEVLKSRLEAFHRQTEPVCYSLTAWKKNSLTTIYVYIKVVLMSYSEIWLYCLRVKFGLSHICSLMISIHLDVYIINYVIALPLRKVQRFGGPFGTCIFNVLYSTGAPLIKCLDGWMRKDEEGWSGIILSWPMFGLKVQSQGQEIFFKNIGWSYHSKNKGWGQPRVDPVPSLIDTEPNT